MSSTHIVVMTSKSVVIASKFYAEVTGISRGAIGESRPIKKFSKIKACLQIKTLCQSTVRAVALYGRFVEGDYSCGL